MLVTRPEHQAAHLCDLLAAEGAAAIRFAAVDIRPALDREALAARLGPLDAFDLIVFTSANAVKFGASLLEPHPRAQGRHPTLAAVGPATARALGQAGFPGAIVPAESFDSESLLLHPELRDVAGRRILIIKGAGGRETLRDGLARRGAHIVTGEVYVRERATHTPENIAALQTSFAADAVQVITATSAEVAANLLALATPPLRQAFDRAHWLVPSARVAAALRAQGMAAPILQAGSAEDHALVAAIVRWRSSVSGA